MDGLDSLGVTRQATALRPLLGLTVLVVEDSRFACEALRMLCLRSGARIRRADSVASARKHLSVYRPSVVIIDVGLPDGSGLPLIEELATGTPRIEVILGISGDLDQESAVMGTGADGFIAKPIASLAAFQTLVLQHLPAERHPPGPRAIKDETITPDPIAYRDDLCHVADVLRTPDGEGVIDYVTQFLDGVARSAQDDEMHDAVARLRKARSTGTLTPPDVAQLTAMVQDRLASAGPI